MTVYVFIFSSSSKLNQGL